MLQVNFFLQIVNLLLFSGGLTERIDDYINKNTVFIFSKTTCPFCTEVKALFSSLGVEVQVLELDQDEQGADIQNALEQK